MVLPGQAIGILGGGQLGRMFAIAARRMGYRVHAFDPTSDCPTGQVADLEINAAYDDIAAAEKFAADVDVVTFEFENVPAETLAAIARHRPVHPSPRVLDTCRHRLHEKEFLRGNGFPVTDFLAIRNVDELRRGAQAFADDGILKSADYGYDGKGQVPLRAGMNLDEAWRAMGRPLGVLERRVKFEKELSVIVARTEAGESRCFAPFENHHVNGILDVTVCPADVTAEVARRAEALAREIAEALEVVGVIAVEMFLDRRGELLVNELAPRPHNSGHLTFDAALTSQFEQQLRAVCGLPLGDPTLLRPAAMANILGDLWEGGEPNWAAALEDPAVKLHLYGKHGPHVGRKMGHLCALAGNTKGAREIVLKARRALTRER